MNDTAKKDVYEMYGWILNRRYTAQDQKENGMLQAALIFFLKYLSLILPDQMYNPLVTSLYGKFPL